jgi:hypothetical protein
MYRRQGSWPASMIFFKMLMETVKNPQKVKLVSRPRFEPGSPEDHHVMGQLLGWPWYEEQINRNWFLLTIFILWGGVSVISFAALKFPRANGWTLCPPYQWRPDAHLTLLTPLISPLQILKVTRLCLSLNEGHILSHHVSLRSEELLCRCQTIALRHVSHWLHKGIIQNLLCLFTLNILPEYFTTYMTNWD